MARLILYLSVIVLLVGGIFQSYDDNIFPRILLFSILGLLALCETIERTFRVKKDDENGSAE